jgi:hypothetical protein
MQSNCPLYTKVLVNKKLGTVRILATFDASKRNKDGDIIVTVQNAAFRSGDIASTDEPAEARERAVERVLSQVRAQCQTDNIVLI